jgi:hypothetical protein
LCGNATKICEVGEKRRCGDEKFEDWKKYRIEKLVKLMNDEVIEYE